MKITISTKKFDKEKSLRSYKELLEKTDEKSLNIAEDNLKQIIKDITRTYPSYKMFKTQETQNKLKNVLIAFSRHYHHTLYFQGMNFIVGFFLYHSEEYVAFWLFVSLIEDYEVNNLFGKGFPGLKLHTDRVSDIVRRNPKFKEIKALFKKLQVNYQIIMVEWLYSLFSSSIPLEAQYDFYYGFFNEGWEFFYKMCISCFLQLKGTFYEAEDVYVALKFEKNKDVQLQGNVDTWRKMIKKAYQIEL